MFKKILILTISCLLIAIVYFTYLNRAAVIELGTPTKTSFSLAETKKAEEEPEKRSKPLGIIADEVYEFLIKTFEKDREIFLSKRCLFGNCSLEFPAHIPGRAWYILSHARAAVSDKTPGKLSQKDRELAAERLSRVLKQWVLFANRNSEVYSTHQLFSAYQLYGEDTALLRWFYSRIPFVESYVKVNVVPTGKRKTIEPYLLMALARQLTQGAHIILNEDLRKQVFKDGKLTPELEKKAEDFIILAEVLINSFSQNENPAVVAEPPVLDDVLFVGEERKHISYPQFICFEKWAKASLLEAYKGSEKYKKKSERVRKDIYDFLENVSEFEKVGNSLNFTTFQSVLSCVHTIHDLKRVLSDFPERLDLRKDFVTKYIIPLGDFSGENACERDGGFFSTFEKKGEVGCQRDKSIVDNSWLYFLLDDGLRQIEITQ